MGILSNIVAHCAAHGEFSSDSEDNPQCPVCHESEPERDYWADDPEYTSEDWQIEVANGDTRASYADWLVAQRALREEEGA